MATSGKRDYSIGGVAIALTVAVLLTILVFVPFRPSFPGSNLDLSWEDAINEAVAQGLVFGHDLIFTFGPLGFVYTRMYHPATYPLIIGFSIFYATALLCGLASIGRKQSPYLLLLIPLCLAQSLLFDAMFIVMPFIFLSLVVAWAQQPRAADLFDRGALAVFWCAVALLPLIKGSFSGAVLACGSLALVVVARKSIAHALLMFGAGAAVMLTVWLALGRLLPRCRYISYLRHPLFPATERRWPFRARLMRSRHMLSAP